MKTFFLTLALGVALATTYLAWESELTQAVAQLMPSQAQTRTSSTASKNAPYRSSQLLGEWYMGTMSGVDCNLRITSATTLSVQFGGCFYQAPPIKTQWMLQGDQIQFQNAALHRSLGRSLRIVRYKNHLVLVPERSKLSPGPHKYSYSQCFWRNLMKNGLELSKDAPT